jgi:hypothetical protein
MEGCNQNALAREILADNNGLARPVSIIDRQTKKKEEIRARIIVVCCATIETTPNPAATRPAWQRRAAWSHAICMAIQTVKIMYLKELEGWPSANQDGALDTAFIPIQHKAAH